MICVVGSLNVDYIACVDHLPKAGQTLRAVDFVRRFGGKGANQAIAAARQGSKVSLIGSVGNDPDGQSYLKWLGQECINTNTISIARGNSTGTALIVVDRRGENVIVVAADANARLSPSLIRKHRGQLTSCKVLLLQFEVPLAAVIEAVQIANESKVPVVLNPSPWQTGFPWGKYAIDSLIVNEGEARSIFNFKTNLVLNLQRKLVRYRIENLIITRGSKPTLLFTRTSTTQIPTLKVKPVDTVGAGDTFAGVYAARRAAQFDPLNSIRYANCAAALATLKIGAQEAIPNLASTEKAVRKLLRK